MGAAFRAALAAESPLQIAGAINAYAALLAQRAGFKALYLSGAGVANHSRGIPDIGDTTLDDVVVDARRIASRVTLPLLVDIDTGWDDPAGAVRALAAAGVAAVHIEDQVPAKLCGHLPGKQIVPVDEMVARVRAAAAGKPDASFVVMARTDAAANESLSGAISRAQAYTAAGADMIFAEATLHAASHSRHANVPRLFEVLPRIGAKCGQCHGSFDPLHRRELLSHDFGNEAGAVHAQRDRDAPLVRVRRDRE
jgi:methylisocitrate lyase